MSTKVFDALPAYLGGKRRLADVILAFLQEALPRDRWPATRLLDPMSGGGAFALAAKAAGFQVTASDVALRAVIPARSLIANSSRRLSRADLALLLRATSDSARDPEDIEIDGLLPSHVDWFRAALRHAAACDEPLRSLIGLLVIKLAMRTQPMSVLNATDGPAAARGEFDRISSRRLGHYLHARELLRPSTLWTVAQHINGGVFPGVGRALRGDACSVIAATDADVLYLDPPYPGTTSYHAAYAPLDALLEDDVVIASAPPTIDDLLDAARHVPITVISYGGPRASASTLADTVARHRKVLLRTDLAYTHLRSLRKESARDARLDECVVIAAR